MMNKMVGPSLTQVKWQVVLPKEKKKRKKKRKRSQVVGCHDPYFTL